MKNSLSKKGIVNVLLQREFRLRHLETALTILLIGKTFDTKLLKTLLFCFCTLSILKAQSQIAIGDMFELKVAHRLQECDITGATTYPNSKTPVGVVAPRVTYSAGTFSTKDLTAGAKFTVINQISGTSDYVVEFWDWGGEIVRQSLNSSAALPNPTTDLVAAVPLGVDPTSQQYMASYNYYFDGEQWQVRYFIISQNEIASFTESIVSKITPSVGVATLPFKYRPITSEFTKDISLNGLGGMRFRIKKRQEMYVHTLIGVNIGSVTIDSTNTDGYMKKSSDFASLGVSFGVLYEWKKLQLGLFVGADHLKKSDINNWRNQGHLWYGAGIGFAIFSKNEPSKEGKNHP